MSQCYSNIVRYVHFVRILMLMLQLPFVVIVIIIVIISFALVFSLHLKLHALVHIKCFKNCLIPCMPFPFLYLRNFFLSLPSLLLLQSMHSLFFAIFKCTLHSILIFFLRYPNKKKYSGYSIFSLVFSLFLFVFFLHFYRSLLRRFNFQILAIEEKMEVEKMEHCKIGLPIGTVDKSVQMYRLSVYLKTLIDHENEKHTQKFSIGLSELTVDFFSFCRQMNLNLCSKFRLHHHFVIIQFCVPQTSTFFHVHRIDHFQGKKNRKHICENMIPSNVKSALRNGVMKLTGIR